MSKRIFIVEDEPDMIELARLLLESDGFFVESARRPSDALKKIRADPPDLVILDVGLPEKDGFEVCREIRADPKIAHLPVIMVSVRSEESNVVVGLRLGADDYVAKPFRQQELLARVHAALRRRGRDPGIPVLESGPFRIDHARYEASAGGDRLDLSPKEFELFAFFLANEGRVLTRKTIAASVWGYDFTDSSRNVDTHVDRLRKKLGRFKSCIAGLRGVGYRFDLDPAA